MQYRVRINKPFTPAELQLLKAGNHRITFQNNIAWLKTERDLTGELRFLLQFRKLDILALDERGYYRRLILGQKARIKPFIREGLIIDPDGRCADDVSIRQLQKWLRLCDQCE